MNVPYSGTEIESEDITRHCQYCEQDPNWKTNRVTGRNDDPCRSIEDTTPEACIALTLFGEVEFKLDLSIFNPSTGTALSRLDATGGFIFVIADLPRK